MDRLSFLLLTSALFSCDAVVEANTLKLLHVFFRHGQKTPVQPYETDPYSNQSYWPEGWAQLTTAGKTQAYELGRRIRHLYKGFIPKEFRDDDVYVYSSDKSRSIMSAQTFLYGLYPPDRHQQWLKGLSWQPIPVHTTPAEDDPLYPGSTCPLAEKEYQRGMALPEVINNDLANYLKEKAAGGKKLLGPYFYVLLHDTLKIEAENNLTLPEWTKGFFPEKIRDAALISYRMLSHTHLLKRLRSGPQLGKITSTFQKYINKTIKPASRRLFLYSIHDWNILLFAETLNLFEVQIPPYAAALMFELHEQSDGQYKVKIQYLNGTDADLAVLVIPGCSDLCPLDQFLNIALPYVPNDWAFECQIHLEQEEGNGASAIHLISFQFLTLAALVSCCM